MVSILEFAEKSHVILREGVVPLASNVLFPPHCAACVEPVDAPRSLCPSCFDKMSFISDPMCQLCGMPFEFAETVDSGSVAVCAPCLSHPPAFDCARSVVHYDAATRPLITRLKYADRTDLVPLLARLMATAGRNMLLEADFLVPVPLHWRRMWSRRFNQAHLLAKELHSLTAVEVLPRALKKIQNTPPQASLTWKERQKNVHGVFALQSNMTPVLKDKKVVLIDDVYTSGATIEACTRQLKKAGVSRVYVLTIARRLLGDLD